MGMARRNGPSPFFCHVAFHREVAGSDRLDTESMSDVEH
jgi:hypothetical protein